MLPERLIVGNCLVFMLDVNMELLLPLTLFLLFVVFVAIKKPFSQLYNNRRFIANMTISIIVGCIYIFYNEGEQDQIHHGPGIYLPIVVCTLLLLCVIYSSVIIIYEVVKKVQELRVEKTAKEYK